MLARDVVAAASTWRPQLFGDRRAADIQDPIIEPLWTGLRVLAYVSGGEARLTDVDGTPIDTHPDIVAELIAAAGRRPQPGAAPGTRRHRRARAADDDAEPVGSDEPDGRRRAQRPEGPSG